MTETSPQDSSAPGGPQGTEQDSVAFEDPAYRAAVVDLLGAITYGEISAFERLADDAKLAEELPDKLALAKMATVQFAHVEPLLERISTLGADPMEAMAPFVKPFDVFHAQTAPSDWLEGLIKAYVGDGLAADFYVEIAQYLDSGTRRLIVDSLADAGHADFVVDRVQTGHRGGPPRGWPARTLGPSPDGGGPLPGPAGGGRARLARGAAGRGSGPARDGPRRAVADVQQAHREPRAADG